MFDCIWDERKSDITDFEKVSDEVKSLMNEVLKMKSSSAEELINNIYGGDTSKSVSYLKKKKSSLYGIENM